MSFVLVEPHINVFLMSEIEIIYYFETRNAKYSFCINTDNVFALLR